MSNRFASHTLAFLMALLLVSGLSGCAFNKGSNEVWDGRDPFAEAAKTAPLTDEFRQRFGLGLTLLMQAQEGTAPADEAQAHWLALTTDYPQYPGVWVNFGLAQSLTGDYDVAALAYREALTINPTFCDAYNLMAVSQREQGLFTESQASYEAAIACNPQQGTYYYNLGILSDLYRNDLESALTAYRKARRLMPDNEELGIWIIDLARRTDQSDEDPQTIDDWYFNLTGTSPAALQETSAETEDETIAPSDEGPDGADAAGIADSDDVTEPETDAAETTPSADVESDQAEPVAEEPEFQYNERINPFLPDDSALETEPEGEAEES